MNLMNATLRQHFQQIGSQRESDDPVIVAHYTMVSGFYHWLAIEYDEKTNTCYGFSYEVDNNGYSGIWSHFSLDELAKLIHPDPDMPIPDVELDSFFPENYRFSQVCPKDFHTWQKQRELWEWEALRQSQPELEYDR